MCTSIQTVLLSERISVLLMRTLHGRNLCGGDREVNLWTQWVSRQRQLYVIAGQGHWPLISPPWIETGGRLVADT